ncbi:unnamed protein product [Somion occarium]|uniref:Heterokaryon incompatibility domain-containing protein n=1 Tax=Somion occarium TaxID=3059160 RepID=A0ABP1CSQ9_9APHY
MGRKIEIYNEPFSKLRRDGLDISGTATPGRYRFMDCDTFLSKRHLRIVECEGIRLSSDSFRYSVISYVWRGNSVSSDPASPCYWQDKHGVFSVKGAEDGDPISLDVLWHACTASELSYACPFGCRWLWLDRICILQTSKMDKAWQISQMYEIYSHSDACIILPGGVRRLVSLDEETSWIHRAWTLQEALTPCQPWVLYTWKHARCVLRLKTGDSHGTSSVAIQSVIEGQSAMSHLKELLALNAHPGGASTFKVAGVELKGHVRLFGTPKVADMLRRSLEDSFRESSIWFSSLMRTSSRPVDMIFSIMHFFGVSLDPRIFGENDRTKAAIALTQGRTSQLVMDHLSLTLR